MRETPSAPSALVWAAAVLVGLATATATRIYLVSGAHWALIAVVAAGVSTAVLLAVRDRGYPGRLARELMPVLVSAGIAVFVHAIISTRMGGGLPVFLRVCLGPACWVGAALLGHAASEWRRVPLVAAAVATWVSAAGGLFALARHLGLTGALGRVYVEWTRALGGWTPAPGEQFRATGFAADPNTYGLIGAVALVFAASVEGRPRLRAFVAAGGLLVVALSGSRTAALSVACAAIAWFAAAALDRASFRERVRHLAPVAGALVAVLLVMVLVVGVAGAPSGLVDRLAQTGTRVAEALGAGDVASAAGTATNERSEIWARGWALYASYPAGVFWQPEDLIGRSVHNEYLERLILGGPLYLGAFLFLLGWLIVRVRPWEAPGFGPAFGVLYAAAAVTLGPSLLPPFLVLGFYLVGWAGGRR